MNDLDRLKVLIYEFLFLEKDRMESLVSSARQVMLMSQFESYYVLKYYEACRRYEDFEIFFRKVSSLLTCYGKNV